MNLDKLFGFPGFDKAKLADSWTNDDGELFLSIFVNNRRIDGDIIKMLIETEKPNCLDAVLRHQDSMGIENFPQYLAGLSYLLEASIIEVLVRHAAKHKIDFNADNGEIIVTIAAQNRTDALQELMLADGINMHAGGERQDFGYNISSMAKLPVLLLLLEDGRIKIDKSSNAVFSHLVVQRDFKLPPSIHVLHEVMKAGADPFHTHVVEMTQLLDIPKEIMDLLNGYKKGNPIEQRVVEKIVVDKKGNRIRHRFYADDTEKMGLHLLPMAFDKYMNSLKVKDMRIMPNGKSRMTFTFTEDIGDGKSRPQGMFASRVIGTEEKVITDKLRDLNVGRAPK